MDIRTLPPLSDFHQKTRLQLRFNDVDVLGHVNNTVYFSFYDTGKAHYFNAVRGAQADWAHVDTVIVNVDCAYVSPITFSDEVEVYTRCMNIGEKSFRLQQVIVERNSGELKSACETVMVAYDGERKRSMELSQEWRYALRKFEEGGGLV